MGSYLTVAQLVDLHDEQEIIQLTNLDDRSATTVNAARAEAAILYAESEVRTYMDFKDLSKLESTGVVPVVLRNKVSDIARYHLDSKRPREDVRQRYEDAIKWLEKLAKGMVSLGLGDNEEVIADQSNDGGATGAPAKTFSRETLEPTFKYGRRILWR